MAGALHRVRAPARRRLTAFACAFGLVCAALPSVSGPGFAQGAVKQKFGDWEMRCENPPGAQRNNAR